MIELHLPQDKPYSEISFIGIAFGGSDLQRHIGVLFRNNLEKEPMLLHLAWHYHLLCVPPGNQYCWLDCSGFDEDEQLQLAVWFEKIRDKNGHKIPYGINYSNTGHFALDGPFITGSSRGLTCATFVMSLFEDFGFPIIDTNSWLERESDERWQQQIMGTLKEYSLKHQDKFDDKHINAQIAEIGKSKRFRPEEVAVAANMYKDIPLKFDEVIPLGEDLLLKMQDKWELLLK